MGSKTGEQNRTWFLKTFSDWKCQPPPSFIQSIPELLTFKAYCKKQIKNHYVLQKTSYVCMQTSAEFLPSTKYIILSEKKLEIFFFFANTLLSTLIVLFSCFELNSKYCL